ncbi:MAG TPA: acyl carrier protein [Waterburya sp.]|jgi:acyl carrier protein
MTRQTRIFERLKKLVVEQLEVDPDAVTPQANFANDLNADELDAVELVRAVEEDFDIELPDGITEEITTVQQAVDYLSAHFPEIEETLEEKRLKELQPLIESIADFWVKLDISEEEALDLTRKAFNVIKDRNIASKRKELSELRKKLDSVRAETKSIEAKIKQHEKELG